MATPLLKPEPTKTRPRRAAAAKNPNQKKQPQRGLGVAQLERLRLQETWKKMTEMPPPHHFQFQSPFLLNPTSHNFPLQFPDGGAPAVVANDCVGGTLLGFDHQGLPVQRLGNGGFIGGGLMAVEAYPHGGGAVDPRLLIGNSVGASRELSSIPKLPPPPPPAISDRDICFKKKRVNFNNIIATAETPAGFDFIGLSPTSPGELTSAAAHGDFGFSTFNFNQGGAEVKQVHRRAAGGGGGVLMEYEFFGRENGRGGSEFEELKMPKEELLGLFAEEVAVVDHGEGSCITTSCTDFINGGSSSSSALDLSLKLSF